MPARLCLLARSRKRDRPHLEQESDSLGCAGRDRHSNAPREDAKACQRAVHRGRSMSVKVICWNMARRRQPWDELAEMEADVALLQETCRPTPGLAPRFEPEAGDLWERWEKEAYDCWPMIVRLSDRVEIERFKRVRPFTHPGGQSSARERHRHDRDSTSHTGGRRALRRCLDVCPVGHAPAVGQHGVTRWDAGRFSTPDQLEPLHVHRRLRSIHAPDPCCGRSEDRLSDRCSAAAHTGSPREHCVRPDGCNRTGVPRAAVPGWPKNGTGASRYAARHPERGDASHN